MFLFAVKLVIIFFSKMYLPRNGRGIYMLVCIPYCNIAGRFVGKCMGGVTLHSTPGKEAESEGFLEHGGRAGISDTELWY